MENWRRFLKENEKLQLSEVQKAFQEIGLNEEHVHRQLDESLLAKLGGIAALAMSLASPPAAAQTPLNGVESTSGHQISFQVDGDGVSVEDVSNSLKRLAAHGKDKGNQKLVDQADEAAGELANIMKDVKYAHNVLKNADTDGDGLGDSTATGSIEFSPTLQAAVDYVSKSKLKKQTNIDGGGDNIPDAQIDQTSVNADLMAKQLELQQKLNPEKSKKAAKDLLQKVKDGNASASPETIKLLQKLAK